MLQYFIISTISWGTSFIVKLDGKLDVSVIELGSELGMNCIHSFGVPIIYPVY